MTDNGTESTDIACVRLREGRHVEYLENHLRKIRDLMGSSEFIQQKLEAVGQYLVEVNELTCLTIIRRSGDEMDDYTLVTRPYQDPQPARIPAGVVPGREKSQSIRIVPCKSPKRREPRKAFELTPEFTIPIVHEMWPVGYLNAEKALGHYFRPDEIRLLKETAKLLSHHFLPAVFPLSQL